MYKEIFEDPNVLASFYLVLYTDAFGTDALYYDPAVIKKEVNRKFEIDIPRVAFNKLLAAINLVISDEFWKDLPKFIILSNALSGGKFDFRVVDLASVSEFSLAITDSLLIWPEDLYKTFNYDIISYIRKMLEFEKFIIPPKILRISLKDVVDVDQDSLLSVQHDSFLYSAAFQIAEEKANEIDQLILNRLKTSESYAMKLKFESVAKLYDIFIRDLEESSILV